MRWVWAFVLVIWNSKVWGGRKRSKHFLMSFGYSIGREQDHVFHAMCFSNSCWIIRGCENTLAKANFLNITCCNQQMLSWRSALKQTFLFEKSEVPWAGSFLVFSLTFGHFLPTISSLLIYLSDWERGIGFDARSRGGYWVWCRKVSWIPQQRSIGTAQKWPLGVQKK